MNTIRPTTESAAPAADGTSTAASLYRLLAWLSPGFPVGAFAYSHGLESAFERGDVAEREALHEWIEGLLAFGSARCDAELASCTHRAAVEDDPDALREIARLGAALFGAPELARESLQLGLAFWRTIRTSWPHPRLDAFEALRTEEPIPIPISYPVAVAVAAAAHGIERAALCLALLEAFVTNAVSASIRLGMLGQTDGQWVIAASEPAVHAAAAAALGATSDMLGSAAFSLDLHALAHETQTTRLFRS